MGLDPTLGRAIIHSNESTRVLPFAKPRVRNRKRNDARVCYLETKE